MSWLPTLFSKHWRTIHLVLIALLSLVLIFDHEKITPHVSGVITSGLYKPFEFIKVQAGLLRYVTVRNDSLRQRLAETALQLSMCQETKRENERFHDAKKLLEATVGSDSSFSYRLIPVKVRFLYYGGYYLPIKAKIVRSERDSFFVDQAIIDQDGLIGRVFSHDDENPVIQLLTDPSSRVAARVSSSGEMGIVKFLPPHRMILDNFLAQGTINVNDTVFSSGVGGVYPPGLIVGTVTEVVRPKDEPFCEITLKPAANFRSLEALYALMPIQR